MKKVKVSELLFFIGYIMIIFSEMFSKVILFENLISIISGSSSKINLLITSSKSFS